MTEHKKYVEQKNVVKFDSICEVENENKIHENGK
jgi:hypothetical protein